MAYIGQSALATSSTTVAPTYTALGLAGGLMLAFVTANETTPATSTLTGTAAQTGGWSLVTSHSASNNQAEIWQKYVTAADIAGGNMPTWNGGTTVFTAGIAEFSVTTFLDRTGAGAVSTTPGVATASAVDRGTGRLIVSLIVQRDLNTSNTGAFTDTYGGSGSANVLFDNATVNQNSHCHSSYCLNATTGTAADTNSVAFTMANTNGGILIASFYAADGWGPVLI